MSMLFLSLLDAHQALGIASQTDEAPIRMRATCVPGVHERTSDPAANQSLPNGSAPGA
jgi:hypothetical protein